MSEFCSRAIVLGIDELGETDREVRLFTELHGKIVARARGSRKITSKSVGHVQPLRFVRIRYTPARNGSRTCVFLDAVWDEVMTPFHTHTRHDLLPIIRVIDLMAPEFHTEPRLWKLLEIIFQKTYKQDHVARAVLSIFGFRPDGGLCASCGSTAVHAFVVSRDSFTCSLCASQLSSDEILLEI